VSRAFGRRDQLLDSLIGVHECEIEIFQELFIDSLGPSNCELARSSMRVGSTGEWRRAAGCRS
jgi:hypothetical protein